MDKVYQPEHPLPDSIKNMSRCETVCQFCGISYLIHSEIKMLQSELEEHKREVERLKEFDTREVLLKNNIRHLNLQYKELTFEYEATKKIDHQKSLFVIEKESEILLLNEKLMSFSTIINEASLNLKNVKHQVICDLLILQEILKKIKNVFCIIMVKFNNFQKEFSELLEEFKLKVMLELRKNFDIMTSLKITIEKLKAANTNLKNVTKEMDMIYTEKMIENEEKKKNDLEQLKVLFHTNKVLQKAFDTLKLENDTLKVENETLKLEKNTLKIENENLKLEKNILKVENENLKLEKNTLKIENEIKKNSQEEFNTLKVENETLKVENENLKTGNDVQKAESFNKCYLKVLDDLNFAKMKQQVQSLLMESKHEKQRHAEQLSFQEKLKIEMDNQHKQTIHNLSECFLKREQKLKSEMDLMQSKCHEKVKMLIVKSEVAQKENAIALSTLKEENDIAISVLKKENDIVVSKLKEEIKRLNESIKSFHINKLLEENEHNYKRKIQELINSLKKTQNDLERKSEDLQDRQQEGCRNCRKIIKRTSISYQIWCNATAIRHYNMWHIFRADLLISLFNIKLLQDCVKRECEERFELTEALAKTKEELLSMQIKISTSSGLLKTKKEKNVSTEANNIEKRDHIIINTGERISKLNEKEARKRCINKDEFDKAKFVISLRNSFRR
ncbi:girdin isoform X5 [Hydra vulgaris]|uniref:Girdin isoform X5 n=1 Tax=Hydra vulgaris TaxID=6087 RepID=A0ABM4C2Z0_HYDVU